MEYIREEYNEDKTRRVLVYSDKYHHIMRLYELNGSSYEFVKTVLYNICDDIYAAIEETLQDNG